MDHRQVNPMLAGLRQLLVILTQATAFAQPGEGALDNPAFGQDFKAHLRLTTAHNLDPNTEALLAPVQQGRAVVAPIQQQQFPPVKQGDAAQQVGQTDFVLPVGRMHLDPDEPPLRIDHQMPFAPFDVFATVIASWPPFSVVLTDWLSAINTLGSAVRPVASRVCVRNRSLIRSHRPPRPIFWKKSYTVDHGGKSCGSIRHEHPVRNTYKIALVYSRMVSGA